MVDSENTVQLRRSFSVVGYNRFYLEDTLG